VSSKVSKGMARREFSARMLGAIGTLFFGKKSFANDRSSPTSPDFRIKPGESYLLAGHRIGAAYDESTLRNFLGVHRIFDGASLMIPVQTDVHSIVKRPHSPTEILTVSKSKPKATYFPSIFDLRDQRIIDAGPSQIFSGHGIYSPDGKLLITSETNAAMEIGVLSIRDPNSLQIIDSIDSGGIFPHEMKFVDNNRLLVANGGSPALVGSNLAVIDLMSKKILETHVPPKFGPGVRHFVADPQGNLVLGTWVTYGNVDSKLPRAQILSSRLESSSSIKIVELGKQFQDLATRQPTQFLSVGLHVSSNQSVLTTAGADVVVVVDSSTGTVLKVLPKLNPTSVSSCGDPQLMAVSDAKGHLQFLDMRSLDWRKDLERTESYLTGSHMEFIQVG
jgi:hypothetical protein